MIFGLIILDDHYYDRGVASCVKLSVSFRRRMRMLWSAWRIQGDMGRRITF